MSDHRGRGMGGMGMVGGGLGTVVLIIVALLFGVNPGDLMQGDAPPTQEVANGDAPRDEMSEFVSVVLADTEDTWTAVFQQSGQDYPEPHLTIFSQMDRSACGMAQSAMGPFYCPNDQTVYIDLSFYDELKQRFGAPGDMAQAYVIAHEVGHHVQNVTGVLEKAQARTSGLGSQAVRVELQADCYAGVWAYYAQKNSKNIQLQPGDVDEALNAAAAIGDDRLQKQTQGRVVPESFTHGTSEQRARWFRNGFESGNPQRCDTFSAGSL